MSTRVTSDEYATLRLVQRGYVGLCECDGPCQRNREEYSPQHSRRVTTHFHNAHSLYATPDNRAIALCDEAVSTLWAAKGPALIKDGAAHA